MFGYVVINKPEMKIKDFEECRSFYCGLCKELKSGYGFKGQLTLTYDLTFLAILLSALYDNETTTTYCKCIAHPFEKHCIRRNEFTEYAADMNILLSYYKCRDDWEDDKKLKQKMMSKALEQSGKKIALKYPEKAQIVAEQLHLLSEYEKQNSTNLDAVSGCFGKILSAICVYKNDEWTPYLSKLGFYLGKYIYILDAYNDYEDDIKNNHYNPLENAGANVDSCREILTLMMAECSKAYEMLPIVDKSAILENIIYSGVWSGFNTHKVMSKGELWNQT